MTILIVGDREGKESGKYRHSHSVIVISSCSVNLIKRTNKSHLISWINSRCLKRRRNLQISFDHIDLSNYLQPVLCFFRKNDLDLLSMHIPPLCIFTVSLTDVSQFVRICLHFLYFFFSISRCIVNLQSRFFFHQNSCQQITTAEPAKEFIQSIRALFNDY